MDIVSIAETKIDASFRSALFVLEGYHWPYSLDISSKSGGILVSEKSSIPSGDMSCENLWNSIQFVPFEINLRKEKWLVISIYCPPLQNLGYFLNKCSKMIDFSAESYENYLIMGDFNDNEAILF